MKLPSTARQLSSTTQNCQNDNNIESLEVAGKHWEVVISYLWHQNNAPRIQQFCLVIWTQCSDGRFSNRKSLYLR